MDKINELIDVFQKACVEHGRSCERHGGAAQKTLYALAEARDTLVAEISRSIRGTDCIDKTGRQIMEGDLVRYNNAGKHVKEDYWNPIYRVVWKAPGFDLEHFGGGKPTDMDTRFLMQHRQDLLEIIESEPADEFEPPDEPEPAPKTEPADPTRLYEEGSVFRAIEDVIAGTQAAFDVINERARQIEDEGFTAAHDDAFDRFPGGTVNALAAGAVAYITEDRWWWSDALGKDSFKPTDRRRNLVKAAALLIAEIERIDRAEGGAK